MDASSGGKLLAWTLIFLLSTSSWRLSWYAVGFQEHAQCGRPGRPCRPGSSPQEGVYKQEVLPAWAVLLPLQLQPAATAVQSVTTYTMRMREGTVKTPC